MFLNGYLSLCAATHYFKVRHDIQRYQTNQTLELVNVSLTLISNSTDSQGRLVSSTSNTTRGMDITRPVNYGRSHPRLEPYHHRTPNTSIERKQVEKLFPEFFTRCSDTSFSESHKRIFCPTRRLNQPLDEPLIQSWLQLYGGDGIQHW